MACAEHDLAWASDGQSRESNFLPPGDSGLGCDFPVDVIGQTPPQVPAANVLDDTSWYDADTGKVIPIHVREVTDDSINRHSGGFPKRNASPRADGDSHDHRGRWRYGLFGSES